MDHGLSDDDLRLLLAEVQRFCHKSLQPLVARPERTIDAAQLTRLTDLATDFGLLNPGKETGAGIWEDTGGSGWVRFSSAALRQIAQTNAGVAFHFHQLALGGYVCRRLGLDCGLRSVACLQGCFGLARCSLARLLKPKPLEDEDRAMLHDYFVTRGVPEPKPLLFQAADDWQQLLVPGWDEQQRFCWSVFGRENLRVVPLPHSHGLNETLNLAMATRRIAAAPSLGRLRGGPGGVCRSVPLERSIAGGHRLGRGPARL